MLSVTPTPKRKQKNHEQPAKNPIQSKYNVVAKKIIQSTG